MNFFDQLRSTLDLYQLPVQLATGVIQQHVCDFDVPVGQVLSSGYLLVGKMIPKEVP